MDLVHGVDHQQIGDCVHQLLAAEGRLAQRIDGSNPGADHCSCSLVHWAGLHCDKNAVVGPAVVGARRHLLS